MRPVRRILALVATLVTLAVAGLLAPRAEAASPYSYYAERQRGETLTIKHNPAPGIVVRNVRVKRAHRVYRHRVVRHAVVHRHTVRHRRVVRRTRVRNVADPAIAGFCRDGGTWLRPASLGEPRIVQKEVCDSVAFYSQKPSDIIVRPDKSRLLPF